MSDGRFVFLDFDDTISDQFRFNAQYVRQIGSILAPQYGGEVEAWVKAAVEMLETLERDYVARFRHRPLNNYCAWLETIRPWCAELLFTAMKQETPHDSREMVIHTQFAALKCCDGAYAGVRAALDSLVGQGCTLYMASGQESAYLQGALVGAGIEAYPRRNFGPDLIDCAKEGPEYYDRVFAACGIAPREAVVVDDFPEAIEWAMQVGARVIQSRLSKERHFSIVTGVAGVLTDMADLPALVRGVYGGSAS